MHILIIEDERKLADAIGEGLSGNGYEVALAHTGESGIRHLFDNSVDLILLNTMLPHVGGLEVLQEIRRNGFKVPVLILTSKGSVDDRVRGLDSGADDYLVKPFAFPELLVRLRALNRRANPESPSMFQIADLKMDARGHTVARGDTQIELTGQEFELLEYLVVNRGTAVSREMIARNVWNTTVRHTSLDDVIDVHIARIRRKVDDPFPTKLLHTVRGVGFILRTAEKS